ncbi:MAG: hypothetical protein ACOCSQ_02550, partial [Planctomycetota bacterium]
PAPFLNRIADPKYIFKGGNLLDIQMGTDPDADPDLEEPAPGDIRLLISRRDGETRAVLYRPEVAGFDGKPVHFESPTGTEDFDSITTTDDVELRELKETEEGFKVTAVVSRELLGLDELKVGKTLLMDVGYIFGGAGGTDAAARTYWHNNSFTANVVNDVPNESRLEPNQWGEVLVE